MASNFLSGTVLTAEMLNDQFGHHVDCWGGDAMEAPLLLWGFDPQYDNEAVSKSWVFRAIAGTIPGVPPPGSSPDGVTLGGPLYFTNAFGGKATIQMGNFPDTADPNEFDIWTEDSIPLNVQSGGGSPGNPQTTDSGWIYVSSGFVTGNANSGDVGAGSGDASGTGTSGIAYLWTGTTNSGNSGEVHIYSGGSLSGDSGKVAISTGDAPSGTKGEIELNGIVNLTYSPDDGGGSLSSVIRTPDNGSSLTVTSGANGPNTTATGWAYFMSGYTTGAQTSGWAGIGSGGALDAGGKSGGTEVYSGKSDGLTGDVYIYSGDSTSDATGNVAISPGNPAAGKQQGNIILNVDGYYNTGTPGYVIVGVQASQATVRNPIFMQPGHTPTTPAMIASWSDSGGLNVLTNATAAATGSGSLAVQTGNVFAGSGSSGAISMRSGVSSGGNTGNLFIGPGDAPAGKQQGSVYLDVCGPNNKGSSGTIYLGSFDATRNALVVTPGASAATPVSVTSSGAGGFTLNGLTDTVINGAVTSNKVLTVGTGTNNKFSITPGAAAANAVLLAATGTNPAIQFNNGVTFGSVTGASPTDVTKHISLYGATFGIGITANRVNYNTPAAGTHSLIVGGTDVATVSSTGLAMNGLGISHGSVFGASHTDLSKHHALYGTTVGFGVESARLNCILPSGAGMYWNINGVDVMSIVAASLTMTSGVQIQPDQLAGVRGTNTNNNANAGAVGEHVITNVAAGSAVAMTTGTNLNVCNVSLTAGDWDVWASIGYTGTATTFNPAQAWISTTSATNPGAPNAGAFFHSGTINVGTNSCEYVGAMRITLTSTTTVYLSTVGTFSGGTMAAYGSLQARRRR